MVEIILISAFVVGLLGGVHCVGMCGGIIGALSLSLPVEIRNNKPRMLAFITTYNIGRILSYSIAGLVAGAIGTGVLASAGFDQGHAILRVIGVGMMIAIGLYLLIGRGSAAVGALIGLITIVE